MIVNADALAECVAPVEAAHVLHHYGEGGIEAGDFTRALIDLLARADPTNLARLGQAFPGYAGAVLAARNTANGITVLRDIAGKLS